MGCEPCHTTETSFMETNFDNQMFTVHANTDDREPMTEIINVDNYSTQKFAVSQPTTFVPFMVNFKIN